VGLEPTTWSTVTFILISSLKRLPMQALLLFVLSSVYRRLQLGEESNLPTRQLTYKQISYLSFIVLQFKLIRVVSVVIPFYLTLVHLTQFKGIIRRMFQPIILTARKWDCSEINLIPYRSEVYLFNIAYASFARTLVLLITW